MNKKTIKEILPVGSVVILKGANKRLMIIGRIQQNQENGNVFDYAACFYPDGIIDPKSLFMFQHEDIERVFFIGFQDSEELAYKEFLKNELEQKGML